MTDTLTEALTEALEDIYRLVLAPYSGVASDVRTIAARALGIDAQDSAAKKSLEWGPPLTAKRQPAA